jgi:hypothetical protein
MGRLNRRRSQIILWILSVLVVLSMILGLVISVLPQSSPAGPASSTPSFQFAVGGESASDPSTYRQFLAQVYQEGNLFLVHTGGLTADGSESSFQALVEVMAGIQLPFFPVPGEKDYYQGTLENFRQYTGMTDPHYTFDYGSVHFVLIDAGLGELTSEEMAWLRGDLIASQQPLKMVFLHYPPLAMPIAPDVVLADHELFVALMEQQEVGWVFAGRVPGYHAVERNGVYYVTTSAPDPSLDAGAQAGNIHHYVRVTVQGTEVDLEVVPISLG